MLRLPLSPRRRAAFTLAEMLVTVALSGVLGSVIYVVGTESLTSFARNVSINRSYSEARTAMDRIAVAVAAAGHLPVLINVDGYTKATVTTAAPRAAGIRFYQCITPVQWAVGSGSITDSSITVTRAGAAMPIPGDLVTIPACNFEGIVTGYSGSTVTLNTTIANGCTATPASTTFAANAYYCLLFRQVAYVAVNGQLRYYYQAPNSTNYTTYVSDKTKYKVIANLPASPTDTTQVLPFAYGSAESSFPTPSPSASPTVVAGNSTTINVRICASGPDYSNRNLATANTFSQVQSSFGPHSPLLLRGTTNPF